MFKNGDVVKAYDRQNFGIVISNDEVKDVITVKFRNPDTGNEAEVEFASADLELVKSADVEPDGKSINTAEQLEEIAQLNISETSALDKLKVKFGADKFIPAFAGYTKAGYDAKSTSIMRVSVKDRVDEKPEIGIWDRNGYAFEPIITKSLSFHNVSKRINEDIEFPAGVIPIFGTTGSGKSTLAYFLTRVLEAEFIRFGEPEIPSIHSPQEVMAVCHDFLNDEESKFLVIDSFRPFMFLDTEKASMGKGGVNNALYMDFTALSSLVSFAGKTIFIVINPLAFNKDDIETVRSNLESSTIGLLHTTEYGQFTFVSRTKANNRIPVLYSTEYNIVSSDFDDIESESINDLNVGKLDYKSGVWNKVLNKIK